MKKSVIVSFLVVLLQASAFAQSAASTIQYYNLSSCNFWNMVSTPSGSGYMCSSYPMSVSVPEIHSMVAAVNGLEADLLKKISDLEARVAKLESAKP